MRWIWTALGVFLLALLAWGGYEVYRWAQGLEARVARLEAQATAQGEALKALGDRLARVEGEVFKAPAPPLPLPESAPPASAPAWPYLVGLLVLVVLLYLAYRLLRRPKEEPPARPEAKEEKAALDTWVGEGGSPRGPEDTPSS